VGVAFDGDDAAGAGGYFLDVRERLFVLQDAGGVVGVLGGDADDGEGFVNESVRPVLHLACRVAFGVDVGDLLELDRSFEGGWDSELRLSMTTSSAARIAGQSPWTR